MRNVAGDDWAPWYAEHRVAPYLRTARDTGDLTADEAAVIERVCERLPALAGPAEPPARLHGDLWSGNVLWSADGAWLIDPAAHGGHRETDLAMLALFGCPHLDTLLAAYDEAAPLAPGWRDRVPLHQLFPLLVHVVLFGRGYAGQAVAAARTALARRDQAPLIRRAVRRRIRSMRSASSAARRIVHGHECCPRWPPTGQARQRPRPSSRCSSIRRSAMPGWPRIIWTSGSTGPRPAGDATGLLTHQP